MTALQSIVLGIVVAYGFSFIAVAFLICIAPTTEVSDD